MAPGTLFGPLMFFILFIMLTGQVDGPPVPRQTICNVDSILHGEPSRDTLSPGESTPFSCDLGYEIVKNKEVTCQTNGSLTELPECESRISFPFMPSIQNGYLVNTGNNPAEFKYLCYTRFYRVGNTTVLITEDNNSTKAHLDTEELPVCLKKEDKVKNCSRIPNIQNGQVIQLNRTATFTCNKGYELKGVSTTMCMANGEWDMHTFPACVPTVKNCSRIPNIQNGQVIQLNRTATFTCNKGYELIGVSTTMCMANGEVDMHTFPACVPTGIGALTIVLAVTYTVLFIIIAGFIVVYVRLPKTRKALKQLLLMPFPCLKESDGQDLDSVNQLLPEEVKPVQPSQYSLVNDEQHTQNSSEMASPSTQNNSLRPPLKRRGNSSEESGDGEARSSFQATTGYKTTAASPNVSQTEQLPTTNIASGNTCTNQKEELPQPELLLERTTSLTRQLP